MASKSTEEPGSSTTSAPGTILLLPHLSFRDRVRMALFLVIPVYARVFLFSSVSVTFWHLYIVGTTGVSIAHFSKGNIGLASVWDVLYGLLEASFPSWGASILWFLWIDHGIVGWRWEVIYWIGVPRRLAYLLPELYGSDVKALIEEYNYTYPGFRKGILIVSATIVYFTLWSKELPWLSGLFMIGILNHFIEYGYLVLLNSAYLLHFGGTVRQNSRFCWNMYKRRVALTAQGQQTPIHINRKLEERVRFILTGDLKARRTASTSTDIPGPEQ